MTRQKAFSQEELAAEIDAGLTYKEIASKFNCTYSLVALRAKEYNLHKYYKYIGYVNEKLTVKEIRQHKGKFLYICSCECGATIHVRPCIIISGIKKSCGCIKPPVSGKLTKTFISSVRNKAKHRNIEFALSLEYLQDLLLKQNARCKFTQVPLTFASHYSDSSFNASLDRIDSSKGYIEGNVQWVTKRINSMKNDMSDSEFIELCKIVSKQNES